MAEPADVWGARPTSYLEVATKVTNGMAMAALDRHVALWKGDTSAPLVFADVAAGPGFFSKALAERLREKGKQEFSILCTDFSQGMIDLAKKSVTDPGVSFSLMDGRDMSTIQDASLDGLNCMFGIMFMPEYPKCIAEMKRVLKRGAKATVGTWGKAGMIELGEAFGVFLGSLSEGEMSEGGKALLVGKDPEALSQMFRDAGFPDVEVVQVDKDLTWSPDDVAMFYGFMTDNPILSKSFITGRPGHKEPSLDHFREFLTTSSLGAPFRKADGSPGCQFVCNLAIATA